MARALFGHCNAEVAAFDLLHEFGSSEREVEQPSGSAVTPAPPFALGLKPAEPGECCQNSGFTC